MKDLNENDIYWIKKDELISIHLSNKPTGKRNREGHLIVKGVRLCMGIIKPSGDVMIPEQARA